MKNFVTLLGAEDVRAAGSAMRNAAGQMVQVASIMEDSLQRHRLFLDDWLIRLEIILQETTKVWNCISSKGEEK